VHVAVLDNEAEIKHRVIRKCESILDGQRVSESVLSPLRHMQRAEWIRKITLLTCSFAICFYKNMFVCNLFLSKQ
jgi:hypothetical protein